MGMHIVIDGYNLICCSKRFDDIRLGDLQAGREALVSFLADYKKMKPYKITVVFDGRNAPFGLPRRDSLNGIELRYSQSGELADAVIKRMALREKEKLLVVTSDNDIARFVQSMGAVTIGSVEFEQRVLWSRYESDKGVSGDELSEPWPVTTQKKGPSRRRSKKDRQAFKKLRKI